MPSSPVDLDELGARLIVHGSRFARSAIGSTGQQRSVVVQRVLSNLRHDGPLRIGELTEREHITQPAMTGVVNKLEADGLVAKQHDPQDARAILVTVTADGIAELERIRSQGAAIVRPKLEALDAADIAVLDRAARLLERLVDALPRGS